MKMAQYDLASQVASMHQAKPFDFQNEARL